MNVKAGKASITSADLVSFGDAAEELGVNRSTVYRMRDRRVFVPFTLGKTDFITRADLDRLKKEREKK